MSRRFYLQRRESNEVHAYQVGDWIDGAFNGKPLSFRLQALEHGGKKRFLLGFRDATGHQQFLGRVQGDNLVFKSAHTSVYEQFAPRRTEFPESGVRQGDILVGSNIWSVDYWVPKAFSTREKAFVLRARDGGVVAVPCAGGGLRMLTSDEQATRPVTGDDLLLFSAKELESGSTRRACFLADDVLYEVVLPRATKVQADFRLATIGFVLQPDLHCVTLGFSDDCTVKLHWEGLGRGSPVSGGDQPLYTLWFEALNCRVDGAAVFSSMGRASDSGTDLEELNEFLRGWMAASSMDAETSVAPSSSGERPKTEVSPRASESELPARSRTASGEAVVNQQFVLEKCRKVLSKAREMSRGPEVESQADDLQRLLDVKDYHEASILAERLKCALDGLERQRERACQNLVHGRRFRVGASDFWFLERQRLARQEVPQPEDYPALILCCQPTLLCTIEQESEKLRLTSGAGGESVMAPELHLGRYSPSETEHEPDERMFRPPAAAGGAAELLFPRANYSVSSRAARFFLQEGELIVAPWRENRFEGDRVVVNFQLVLEEPQDRALLKDGDWLVLGNLLLKLQRHPTAEAWEVLLAGALLESSDEELFLGPLLADSVGLPTFPPTDAPEAPAEVSMASGPGVATTGEDQAAQAQARIRFQAGCQLTEGDAPPDGTGYRFGTYLIHCESDDAGIRLRFDSNRIPLLRFGRSDAGKLLYSQQKRLTRVQGGPLYPEAETLAVGLNWSRTRDLPGVDLRLYEEGTEWEPSPLFFEIALDPETKEPVCQPGSWGAPLSRADKSAPLAHLRDGEISPNAELRPGDLLVCPPVTFQVSEVEGVQGMELELDILLVTLASGRTGWIAGLEAELPDPDEWVLRIPAPVTSWKKARWTSAGRFEIQEEFEMLGLEEPAFPVSPEASFHLFEAPRITIGGPGSCATLVHRDLQPGALFAEIESADPGACLRPLGPGISLWWRRGDERVDPVPPEGISLQEGDRFGIGKAELEFQLTF